MRWRAFPIVALTPTLIAGAIFPVTVHAQSAAQQRERALARQLAESESKVRALQERLDRLEQRFEAMDAARPAAGTAAAPTLQPPPAQARVPAPPPAAPTASAAPPRPPASRPGSFEVDEDAAQRALERTLTQAGALLLPPGAYSITPSLSYQRSEQESPRFAQATDPTTGATGLVLGSDRLRRNEFQGRLELRAGLPMASQVEVSLPYNYVRSSRVDSFGDTESANGSGIGDLTIGLAKTLVRERGAVPDLIGRLSFNTGTGERSDNRVALSSGYRQAIAELVALKRQDPLAFFAAASHAYVFERGDERPGNVTNLSLGTVLAASPATSLQFGFTQTYRREHEIDGRNVPGSDQTYGTVSIGASSILSRNAMLIVSTGIGVGGDAPKYSFNLSLPITFR